MGSDYHKILNPLPKTLNTLPLLDLPALLLTTIGDT